MNQAVAQKVAQPQVAASAGALAPVSSASSLLSAIMSVAQNKEADIEKMERLFAMHRTLVADEAKAAFYADLSLVQSLVPIILTNSTNTHTRSKYADLAAVNDKLVPIYTKQGFSVSVTCAKAEKPDEMRWLATLGHRMGHEKDYWVDLPSDTAGAKGNANKNAIQGVMSSSTYARRYLEFLIFNVATADSDGNLLKADQLSDITESQRVDFESAIEACADPDGVITLYRSIVEACDAAGDGAKETFLTLKGKCIAKGAALGAPDGFLKAKAAAKAEYPAKQFDKNMPAWTKAVKDGSKTPEAIINMVQTKYALTPDQTKKIHALKSKE